MSDQSYDIYAYKLNVGSNNVLIVPTGTDIAKADIKLNGSQVIGNYSLIQQDVRFAANTAAKVDMASAIASEVLEKGYALREETMGVQMNTGRRASATPVTATPSQQGDQAEVGAGGGETRTNWRSDQSRGFMDIVNENARRARGRERTGPRPENDPNTGKGGGFSKG